MHGRWRWRAAAGRPARHGAVVVGDAPGHAPEPQRVDRRELVVEVSGLFAALRDLEEGGVAVLLGARERLSGAFDVSENDREARVVHQGAPDTVPEIGVDGAVAHEELGTGPERRGASDNAVPGALEAQEFAVLLEAHVHHVGARALDEGAAELGLWAGDAEASGFPCRFYRGKLQMQGWKAGTEQLAFGTGISSSVARLTTRKLLHGPWGALLTIGRSRSGHLARNLARCRNGSRCIAVRINL